MKQEDLWTFVVAGVVAVGASWATSALSSAPDRPVERGAADTSASLAALERSLTVLEGEQRTLESRVAEVRTLASPASPSQRTQATAGNALELAVGRWMEANAPALASGKVGDMLVAESNEIEAAVERILGFGEGADMEFWQSLREEGRLDGVMDRLESLVEASPLDPDLRAALADSYVQKVFDVGYGPERERFSELADAAYDEALRLDDDHWGARFGKALALSNQPAFQGKSVEAIREFEVLVSKQEERPAEPRFAQTYFFLGNMYQDAGEAEKAMATWERGVELFPQAGMLQGQIDSFGGNR